MKNVNCTDKRPTTDPREFQKPLPCFLANIEDARALLAKISEHLDDHLGADPEKVDWGHVGDAARLRIALEEIAETHQLIKPKGGR